MVTQNNKKRRGWVCSRGHTWNTTIQIRIKQGGACPRCLRIAQEGGDGIIETHPLIAAQADGWDPTGLTQGSNKKVKWRCEAGHSWESKIIDRIALGNGCPSCRAETNLTENNLAARFPEVAREADGWDPTTVAYGSNKKLPWVCFRGHRWDAVVTSRTRPVPTKCVRCRAIDRDGGEGIAETHPDIAAQADGWDPTTVAPGSNKKLAWKCSKGHVWEARVNARVAKGDVCPTCNPFEDIKGRTLLDTHPDIAAEADGWDPRTITYGTGRKMAWKCSEGHKWEAAVSYRTSKNDICLACRQLARFGGRNLAETYPLVAAEADGWDPTIVTHGSAQVMPWVCKDGHKWEAPINRRTVSRTKCPECLSISRSGGRNILESHPEIAAEADGWDPKTVTHGINKKLSWLCPKGHKWVCSVVRRTAGGVNCFICNRDAKTVNSSIAETHPEIAKEAKGWDPSIVTRASQKRLSWLCPKGHVWEASPRRRTQYGVLCTTCERIQKDGGANLAETHPEIAAQADGWDPALVTYGSPQKLPWVCNKGHKWQTSVNARTCQRTGCPKCTRKGGKPEEPYLNVAIPELAAQADGWDPSEVRINSFSTRKWICDKKHRWEATVASRAKRGRGCPYCAGKKVLAGFNDLATTHPEVAEQAEGWDPTTISKGSHKKMLWRGLCGHSWEDTVTHRAHGRGCPYCGGKRILLGFNDLASQYPSLADEAYGWDPSTVLAGTHAKKTWKAACGHIWEAQVGNRTAKGYGCPHCRSNGFNNAKPAWFYLLAGLVGDEIVLQFGITALPKIRLAVHKRSGFVDAPVALIPFTVGEDALKLEQKIKKLQKERGVPTAVRSGLAFSGASEAFVYSDVSRVFAEEVVALLNVSIPVLNEAIKKCSTSMRS